MNLNRSLLHFHAVLATAAFAFAPAAKAQLQIQGNIESEITGITTSSGLTTTAKYATTPPGYTSTSSINQSGSGVFTSAYTLAATGGSGAATLLYKPSSGTANPLSSFGGIEVDDTVGLGSLQLSNNSFTKSGTVDFTWNVDFANLQLFDGSTPVTSDLTDVWILSVPLSLTLNSGTHTATLALTTPFDPATMFDSTVALGGGYVLDLKPADTLDTLVTELSSGTFTSGLNDPHTFGTTDAVVTTIMTPVPEPSTYAIWGVVAIVGMVGYSRMRKSWDLVSEEGRRLN